MSLINDMLRDLEQRRDKEVKNPSTAAAVQVNWARTRSSYLVVAGLVLCGVLCGAVLYFLSTESTPLAALESGGKENSVTSASASPPLNDSVITQVNTSEVPGPIVAPSDADDRVELSTLEFTSGKQTSVFTLSFSAHPEYRFGQERTGNKRLEIAFPNGVVGRNLVIPDIPSAGLIKEFSLKPESSALLLRVDLTDDGFIDSVQSNNSGTAGFLLKITIQRSIAQVTEKTDLPAAKSVALEGAKVAEAPVAKPVASVTEQKNSPVLQKVGTNSAGWRNDYQRGIQQLKQGQLKTAEQSFQRVLDDNPQMIDARLQLIALLQRQGLPSQAETVLVQGLDISPADVSLRKLRARQLLARKAYAEGIKLLNSKPVPVLNGDSEYFGLLAVLFHDAGDYPSALGIYQQLVNVQPNNSTWWFGLALCADQSSNLTVARQAYRKALALPTLRADLQAYAQQRLQQLLNGKG